MPPFTSHFHIFLNRSVNDPKSAKPCLNSHKRCRTRHRSNPRSNTTPFQIFTSDAKQQHHAKWSVLSWFKPPLLAIPLQTTEARNPKNNTSTSANLMIHCIQWQNQIGVYMAERRADPSGKRGPGARHEEASCHGVRSCENSKIRKQLSIGPILRRGGGILT